LAIKILEINSVRSIQSRNELIEKAALWDVFCLLKTSDYQWLIPFFWSKETNEPSTFAYALALGYKYFGESVTLRHALGSKSMLSVANLLRKSQESGGHPVGERTLFILLRLVNGAAYKDVLKDERKSEVLTLYERKRDASSEERRHAVERAKGRVKRAKMMLLREGVNIKWTSLVEKHFQKLLLKAELEFNEAKYSDS
jgi:hypothetical protein